MTSHVQRRIRMAALAGVAVLALTAAGAGNAAPTRQTAGTITVGLSTTLSGAIAQLGQGGLDGIQLAIDDLNAKGGLLGKRVDLVSADDGASPATGSSNVRSMILDKHIAALFGPVSSAVAAAELQLADQYKVPTFLHTSNDISLMTSHYTPYAFQVVPNTMMEPRAVASFLAAHVGSRQLRIATFAPDYSFGHSTVNNFLQALKDLGVNFELVDQEWPALGAPNIAPQLSSLISKKPELTFNVQYGGDLVNFTNQAAGYGFFKSTRIIAMYALDPLGSLRTRAPAGGIAYSRAPFWAIKSAGMPKFISEFKAKYHAWPDEWAILGYSAVQTWAFGVQKAKSLDADKVSQALAGATVPTVRGPIAIRACDHQAAVPEYVSTIASKPDPRTKFPLWSPVVFRSSPAKTMLTCAQSLALRQG